MWPWQWNWWGYNPWYQPSYAPPGNPGYNFGNGTYISSPYYGNNINYWSDYIPYNNNPGGSIGGEVAYTPYGQFRYGEYYP